MSGQPERLIRAQAGKHAMLVAKIACIEQQISNRQRAMRAHRTALSEALRARITSPLTLMTAFSAGYVFGRYLPQPVTGPHDESSPSADRSVLQRLLLAAAVVQSWRPLLRALAFWFERPLQSSDASRRSDGPPRADACVTH